MSATTPKTTPAITLPETRCPFCHESVIAGKDEQHGCQKCRAWHHRSCWIEHGGCSTCNFHDEAAAEEYKAILRAEEMTVGTEAFKARNNQWKERQEKFKIAAKDIKESPEYKEVYGIAKANATGKVYLVGGKVYRTLASIFHWSGEEDILDCGEDKCDWDFLVDGFNGKATKTPNKWCYTTQTCYDGVRLESPYKISQDVGLVRWNKVELRRDSDWGNLGLPEEKRSEQDEVLCKIDVMNINKVRWINANKERPSWYQFWKKEPPPLTLEDYFAAVPMSIQAVAFDPITESFTGPGIESIMTKKISANNLDAIEDLGKRGGGEPIDLLREKAKSIGNGFVAIPPQMTSAQKTEFENKLAWDRKRAWEKALDPHDV